MPRMDGTGPNGNGPKTGRGLGQCGIEKEKYTDMSPYSNRNLGGGGQGFRRGFGRCGNGLARFGFGLRQRVGGLFSRRSR